MAASARLSVRLAAVALLLAASVAAPNIATGRGAPNVAMVSLTARLHVRNCDQIISPSLTA
jgi:hypothetical protein